MKMKRYRLRPGTTLDAIRLYPARPGEGRLHENAVLSLSEDLTETLSVHIGFPRDLEAWNDFDYILVADDLAGETYSPFYGEGYGRDIPKGAEPLYTVVQRYNQVLDGLDFLEEIPQQRT